MNKVDVNEKLTLFGDYWNPKIVGDLNGQHIKLAKFKGEFVWHKHDNEDEMFFVVDGELQIRFRDKTVCLTANEFIVIPKGVEHLPVAKNEVSVMLIEPATTLNTGDAESDLKRDKLERI